MEKTILEWLLAGPAWLRFAVEKQLLDATPDIAPVLPDGAVQKLLARLKAGEAGIPALKNGKVRYTDTGKASGTSSCWRTWASPWTTSG